jgi:hypothetical protein
MFVCLKKLLDKERVKLIKGEVKRNHLLLGFILKTFSIFPGKISVRLRNIDFLLQNADPDRFLINLA